MDQSILSLSRYKTVLCRNFAAHGTCQFDVFCEYAHGSRELRTDMTHSSLYKTQPCRFYMKGRCKNGSKCRWAHGDEELRPAPALNDTYVPAQDLRPATRLRILAETSEKEVKILQERAFVATLRRMAAKSQKKEEQDEPGPYPEAHMEHKEQFANADELLFGLPDSSDIDDQFSDTIMNETNEDPSNSFLKAGENHDDVPMECGKDTLESQESAMAQIIEPEEWQMINLSKAGTARLNKEDFTVKKTTKDPEEDMAIEEPQLDEKSALLWMDSEDVSNSAGLWDSFKETPPEFPAPQYLLGHSDSTESQRGGEGSVNVDGVPSLPLAHRVSESPSEHSAPVFSPSLPLDGATFSEATGSTINHWLAGADTPYDQTPIQAGPTGQSAGAGAGATAVQGYPYFDRADWPEWLVQETREDSPLDHLDYSSLADTVCTNSDLYQCRICHHRHIRRMWNMCCLRPCGHEFHVYCVARQLDRTQTKNGEGFKCPICRRRIGRRYLCTLFRLVLEAREAAVLVMQRIYRGYRQRRGPLDIKALQARTRRPVARLEHAAPGPGDARYPLTGFHLQKPVSQLNPSVMGTPFNGGVGYGAMAGAHPHRRVPSGPHLSADAGQPQYGGRVGAATQAAFPYAERNGSLHVPNTGPYGATSGFTRPHSPPPPGPASHSTPGTQSYSGYIPKGYADAAAFAALTGHTQVSAGAAGGTGSLMGSPSTQPIVPAQSGSALASTPGYERFAAQYTMLQGHHSGAGGYATASSMATRGGAHPAFQGNYEFV